jgi:hypothetical protein
VALALQQLDTVLSFDRMLYTTCLDLAPTGAAIEPCETDLLMITGGRSRYGPYRPQILVGECKAAGGSITADDADHLARVADAFPPRRLSVFVLFAKTGKFSVEEIAACARAQHKSYSRVILLSQDELEPYRVYERHTEKLHSHAGGLEELAENTTQLYPTLTPAGLRRLHPAGAQGSAELPAVVPPSAPPEPDQHG